MLARTARLMGSPPRGEFSRAPASGARRNERLWLIFPYFFEITRSASNAKMCALSFAVVFICMYVPAPPLWRAI
jgi:hypothetical protein